MKYLPYLMFLAFINCANASPQFSACAFDAKILEQPTLKGSKYEISFETVQLIYFVEDNLWQNSSRFCFPLNKKVTKTVCLSEEDALDLSKFPVGSIVRIVREYVDGMYIGGEVYDSEEYKLWRNTDYKINTLK